MPILTEKRCILWNTPSSETPHPVKFRTTEKHPILRNADRPRNIIPFKTPLHLKCWTTEITKGRSSELCSVMFLDSHTWKYLCRGVQCPVVPVYLFRGQVAVGSHYARAMIFFSQVHILYIFPETLEFWKTPNSLKAPVNKGKRSIPWNPEALGLLAPWKHIAHEALQIMALEYTR